MTCSNSSHYENLILFGSCPTCKHVFSLPEESHFEPYEQPPVKPLEPCWWDVTPTPAYHSEYDRRLFEYQHAVEQSKLPYNIKSY